MEYNFIRNAPTLQLASVPNKNDLYCLETIINPEQRRDASAKSAFHWQILKCRIIIFSLPEVIACPNVDFINQVTVITRKNDSNLDRLKKLLEQQKMTVMDGPNQTTDYNYRSCLRYTIGARTAPLWNPLGEYFAKGRDFLSTDDPVEVVDIELKVTDTHLIISIRAEALRMPRLTLSHLGLTERCATELWGSGDVINDASLGTQWVFVLPSLKKGRVIAVWKKLPPSCPYKTYKELRRHWKNAYGYRLPESSEDMLFYEIYFRPLGPVYYTYPDICVRPFNPTPMRCDASTTIQTFLKDVSTKMPAVCEKPFVVFNLGGEASCDLISGTQAENTTSPNMTALKSTVAQGTSGFSYLNSQSSHAYPSTSQWSQQIPGSGLVSLCTPTQGVRAFINPWTVPTNGRSSSYHVNQSFGNASLNNSKSVQREADPKDISVEELSQELRDSQYGNGKSVLENHLRQSEAIRSRKDLFANSQIDPVFESPESRVQTAVNQTAADLLEGRRRQRTPPPFVPLAVPLQPLPRAEQRYVPLFNKSVKTIITTSTGTSSSSMVQTADENSPAIPNLSAVKQMTIRVVEKSYEVRPLFKMGGVKRKIEIPKIELQKRTAKQINKGAAPKRVFEELDTVVLLAGGRPVVEKATIPALLAWLKNQGVIIRSKSVKADIVDKVMSTLDNLNN